MALLVSKSVGDKGSVKTDSVALYAFSADPITYGHIDVVERMADCFSRCIVGIGRNPTKSYLFSEDERFRLAKLALAHLSNVEVMTFDGMVVDFAFEQNAKVIIKGIRSAADMEYEQVLHQVGVSQELGIDTHILFANPSLSHVSSSVVKAMQSERGFIGSYVPPVVKAALEMKLSNQLVIGLTGDIAAGKSTLASSLVERGIERGVDIHNIDLDKLGHQILDGEGIGQPMYESLANDLVDYFGVDVVEAGCVNRKILAEKIFDDEDSRSFMNARMSKPMSILLRRALKNKKGIILLNGALLPDLGLLGLCNYRSILCVVEDDEQEQRLKRRGLSIDQIRSRRSSQLSGNQKRAEIVRNIEKEGFGCLWIYDARKTDVANLLSQILTDCEECQWHLPH